MMSSPIGSDSLLCLEMVGSTPLNSPPSPSIPDDIINPVWSESEIIADINLNDSVDSLPDILPTDSTESLGPTLHLPLLTHPIHSYFDYLLIISRVMKDKCWHLLWHFDLFEKVDRVYPETSYYRHWWDVVYDPTYIGDNLYVGSAFNAADLKMLKNNGISHIINTTESISNYFPSDFTYINYPTEDLSQGSLLSAYTSFYQTVMDNPQSKILVHCYAGRSRSVSLVVYYLMRRYEWGVEKTLDYVRSRRPNINVNIAFIKEIQGLLHDKVACPTELHNE